LVPRDYLVVLVRLELQVQQVVQELQVIKDHRDNQVWQDLLGLQGITEQMAQAAHLVQPVQPVYQVYRVQPDRLDYQDQLVLPAFPGNQDYQGQVVHQDLLVVQEILARLVPRDPQEILEL